MLIFLKLGGSLITDKSTPRSARFEIIKSVSREIFFALEQDPSIQLLIGHGAGSFAHVPASKYQTRQGVKTRQDWLGFVEVWKEARLLNQIILESLEEVGLPVISFPPSAMISTQNGQVINWDITPIHSSISHNLIPLVYGDVIFDENLGGTILSTEELFAHLAISLRPQKILLAGINAVCSDFPACQKPIDSITNLNLPDHISALGGSESTDVTGGMLQKVTEMIHLTRQVQGLRAQIFSALEPGILFQALMGKPVGTIIHSE